MRFVVDASVIVAACLSPAGFEPLEGHDLIAPPLLWSEASSVLHEMAWRGELDRADAVAAVERLDNAPIARHAVPGSIRQSWAVADELGWAKTYDAEYVAAALALGTPLLTIDDRLRRTVGKTIQVLGPLDIAPT